MLSYNDSLANPAASGGYCARFRGSRGLQSACGGPSGGRRGIMKPPLCLILLAAPWVPFREIVVIGLPRGACALKLAAILPHPYAAKYGWQAHPAWDAVRSVEELRRVVGVAAEMQATGRLPALAAAVATGGSSTVQSRGCVTDELKVRASTGRPSVLAAAVVASDDSPAVQSRGCESDELIIRASAEQAA
jgi:hypothetical protein